MMTGRSASKLFQRQSGGSSLPLRLVRPARLVGAREAGKAGFINLSDLRLNLSAPRQTTKKLADRLADVFHKICALRKGVAGILFSNLRSSMVYSAGKNPAAEPISG